PLVRTVNGERVERLVEHQATAHALLSLGLFDRFELGLDVPVLVWQEGEALPGSGVNPQDGGLGIGDIRVVPKVQLFSTREDADDSGVALALLVDAHIPTGQA